MPQQPYRNQRRDRNDPPTPMIETSNIQFNKPAPDLFDGVANDAAKVIADSKREVNTPTQLRTFYDEITMWDQKLRQNPGSYDDYLPLIKMINAKVAYAKGRNLVDDNFVKLMRHALDQVSEKEINTFHTCKLFFEAFMGFYKMHKPK